MDHIETNPRKLPQLRSLNPQERREVETTRPTNLIDPLEGFVLYVVMLNQRSVRHSVKAGQIEE